MKKKFLLLGFLSEIAYLFFWIVRFFPFSAKSPYDLLKNNYNFGIVLGIFLLVFVFYVIASIRVNLFQISPKLIFGFAVLFNLTLVLMPPIASDDVFSYISESRVVSKYRSNPYYTPYNEFKDDILYSKIKTVWSKDVTNYGPLFTLFGTALTFIGGDNLLINIYLFKTTFIALNLLIAWLIFKVTKSKLSLVLYSWNPLIMFETSLNAHNDILMVMFFVLSLYFLFKDNSLKSHLLSWILLIFSVLVKYFTAIFIPFYLVLSLVTLRDKLEKIKFLILSVFCGLLTAVLIFFPFWESPDILSGALGIYSSRTFSLSPGIAVVNMILSYFLKTDAYNSARTISQIILGVISSFGLFWLIKSNKDKLSQLLVVLSIVFASMLGFGFNLLVPRYFVLLIVILSFCIGLFPRKKIYTYFLHGATIYAFLLYFIVR